MIHKTISLSTGPTTFYDVESLQILSFSKLRNGWDSGSGGPISTYVIERAIKLFKHLKNMHFSYEITPLSFDGIQITFFVKDHFLDVIVTKSKFGCRYERGIGEEYEVIFEHDNQSIQNINSHLNSIITKCFLSEPSTFQNTVQGNEGLTTYSPTFTEVFPYFLQSVQSKSQAGYANTLRDSIAV